ncbi:alcohol dehydrogenase catalytic domain-containing protein [Paenibacillus gansuensis]|uniref:Alcohol dehydrogenase catalytic domain-containing protein n=1 Tax=Paenibacillus gansuensis TaxID=306542 RepID=A0ABW5PBK6_9BACL
MMKSTYLGARFTGNKIIAMNEMPIPVPGPGQLLIKVKANALCGSERGQYMYGSAVTPGHEAAGIVADAGAGTAVKPGTPGVVYLMDFCGSCRSCKLGFTNQCLNKRGDMGFNRNGGYGQYMLVSENIFYTVDEGLDLTEATLLLDIMGTGGHALERGLLVHPDIQSVAIAGAGPIGLGVLVMAKLLLGEKVPVVISDTVPYRLELARKLGGIPIDALKETLKDGLEKIGLAGADLAADTSGKTIARKSCLEALDKRGVLVCVGHGEGLGIDVSKELIEPERSVLGSEYFRYGELNRNMRLLLQNREYITRIITHRFPLENIQEAFELFFAGSTGKVVIEQ